MGGLVRRARRAGRPRTPDHVDALRVEERLQPQAVEDREDLRRDVLGVERRVDGTLAPAVARRPVRVVWRRRACEERVVRRVVVVDALGGEDGEEADDARAPPFWRQSSSTTSSGPAWAAWACAMRSSSCWSRSSSSSSSSSSWRRSGAGGRGLDRLSHAMDLVGGQIVHDDDVAGPQLGHERLFDIGRKASPSSSAHPGPIGAAMPSWRSPAVKVVVFQWPGTVRNLVCGAGLAITL